VSGFTPAERAVDSAETTMASCAKRIRDLVPTRRASSHRVCVRLPSQPARPLRLSGRSVRAVERYLDGDRDLEARGKLAEHEANGAALALENLQSDALELPAANAARAKALRRAGRALALDPSQPIAQDIVLRMMVWSPSRSDVPEEVTLATEQRFVKVFQRGALAGPCCMRLGFRSSSFCSHQADGVRAVTWLCALVVRSRPANARSTAVGHLLRRPGSVLGRLLRLLAARGALPDRTRHRDADGDGVRCSASRRGMWRRRCSASHSDRRPPSGRSRCCR
jgi:hypothetical protein